MKKSIILGIVILIGIIVIFFLSYFKSDINEVDNNNLINDDKKGIYDLGDSDGPPAGVHIIEMSSLGFSPALININVGDEVIFLGIDESNRWPASNVHPTHTSYPGSGIQKCEMAEKNTIFDSCGSIAGGKEWSFIFNEIGEWNYHDHMEPSKSGKIIVFGHF